jgi:predicted  nucleic acid-binding Zn-ribbon protein
MTELNNLPSTEELMEMAGGGGAAGHEERSQKGLRPVAEMWQAMQLSRKVDANTQGVSKLMSLVEDLMCEMQKLKDSNDDLQKRLKEAAVDSEKWMSLMNKLQELEKLTNEFDSRVNNLNIPSDEFYDGFVTWSALEDALKGLKQQWAGLSQDPAAGPIFVHHPPSATRTRPASPRSVAAPASIVQVPVMATVPAIEPVQTPAAASRPPVQPAETSDRLVVKKLVAESANQTDAMSRPTSRYQSRGSTPGPSTQLQDLLERLGRLSDQHDELEERVRRLESELKNKASKDDLKDLGISKQVADQMANILQDIEALKDTQGKDHSILIRLQQTLQQLQSDLDRLNKAFQRLCDDLSGQRNEIDRLSKSCKDLEEKKADKEYVLNEINVKADKDHLDAKVNRNQFDNTCDEINHMINDILSKLLGTEGEWKNAMGQLSSEMESKMDRLEFGPFRDELERQLRALAGKLSSLQNSSGRGLTEDEAAGIRKQLIQRFHCISCDKPVDMSPRQPVASLPGQPGLPENRSMRPYLVYDLDQIRQYARGRVGTGADGIADVYTTARACGGSHTMTFPHRRITKLQRVGQRFPDDGVFAPTGIEDQVLCEPFSTAKGSRSSATKLPNVHMQVTKSASYGSTRHPLSARSHSPHPPLTSSVDQQFPVHDSPRSASAKPNPTPRVSFGHRSTTASPRNHTTSPWQSADTAVRVPSQEVKVQLPQITIEDRHSVGDDATVHLVASDTVEPEESGVKKKHDFLQEIVVPQTEAADISDAEDMGAGNGYIAAWDNRVNGTEVQSRDEREMEGNEADNLHDVARNEADVDEYLNADGENDANLD